MNLLEPLLELLFPRKCLLCGRILEKNETDLCGHCRTHQPLCPMLKTKYQFLDSTLALWYYEENAAESLRRFKFRGCSSYADGYGRLLAMKIAREREDGVDLIVWVPVSRLRRFRRGYDQVELLAKALSRELNVPAVKCLRKIRHNPPQSGIADRAKRRANVLGVYKATNCEAFAAAGCYWWTISLPPAPPPENAPGCC